MNTPYRSLLSVPLLLAACAAASACSNAAPDNQDEGESSSALKSAVSCTEQNVTGYAAGKPYAMQVITVGGKKTAMNTAHAFLKLQAAADKAGVALTITSGFRTMAEQQTLYNCYLHKNCNSGNLAAKPGYSNHQNGRALDLDASNFNWLIANASKYGFAKTVSSERWHYEYSGADPGGPCSGGGMTSSKEPLPQAGDADPSETDPTDDAPSSSSSSSSTSGSSADGCYSPTMKATMAEGACVRSTADEVMYQCHDGLWYRNVIDGSGPFGACVSIDEP